MTTNITDELTEELTEEQTKEFFNIFKLISRGNNDYITKDDFIHLLKKLGIERTDIEIENIIKTLDYDGNNKIDFNELILFLNDTTRIIDNDNLNDSFNILDKGKKGYIILSDLLNFCAKVNLNIPSIVLQKEFNYEDFYGKGKINLLEFRRIIERKSNITSLKLLADLLFLICKAETTLLKKQQNKYKMYERHDFLKELYIFEKTYRIRLYKIAKNITEKEYSFREIIFNKFDKLEYIYIIISGEVNLYEYKKNEEIKSIKGRGYILGLREYNQGNKVYYLKARSNNNKCKVYQIKVKLIKELLDIDPVFKNRVIDMFIPPITLSKQVKSDKYRPKKIQRIRPSYSKLGNQLDYLYRTKNII